MIGKIVSFLALVAVVFAAARFEDYRPYEGIDPNTVSCDAVGLEFLLLPHYTNCSQFYMCNHGEEVEFNCGPGGLVFDFELQGCNWDWAVPCLLRNQEEGSGDDAEITIFSENDLIGDLTAEASGTVRPVAALSAIQANNAAALICGNAHSAARQVAYKGDCQRYWKCVAGVPQTAFCSDGLYFNEATMQCDHEANVRCGVHVAEELNGEFIVYE